MTALQSGGGIRTFFRYVYSQDCFSDCNITLIAPDEGLHEYIHDYLPAGRISIINAKNNKLSFVGQVRTQLLKNSFALVHSHGFTAGALTILANTNLGYTHLMTGHDMFLRKQFTGVKGRLKLYILGLLFNRLDHVHTATSDARQNFLEFFPSITARKVTSIVHGIDTASFISGQARLLKSELSLDEETLLIGFFGRFMGPKGFRILIDAIKQIQDNHLITPVPHVVTFGWGGFIREDYAWLEQQGLGEYFHQLPKTDNMPAALKGVDLVAMPSRWEACGLLAMEALTAGVPIVGTDCLGLREVLSDTPAKTVKSDNALELANVIVEELKDIKNRKKVFVNFAHQAALRFDIERPAHAIRKLYDDLPRREN